MAQNSSKNVKVALKVALKNCVMRITKNHLIRRLNEASDDIAGTPETVINLSAIAVMTNVIAYAVYAFFNSDEVCMAQREKYGR